jgi:putative DNA primase/helicase
MNDNILLRNIPNELKMNGLWCGWKLTENGKEPFNLSTGAHAKSNDPNTFSSYPVLLNNIHKYLKFDNDKQVGGVGLGIFRGYSAIDIDHCISEDGTISDMAKDIVKYCDSYTEYSPSKTGIRIIFKTNVKIDKANYYINNSNVGLEIYISDNTNKFVSITGNKICGDNIREVDIQYILDKYMKKGQFHIEKVLKKDEKLKALWNKQAPGSHADESESDMALACKLAYYLKNDEVLVKQFFEQSPYFKSKDPDHIKKWNNGYGLETIKKASSYIGPVENQSIKIRNYDLNDTGNAHRFIDMFGDILRYNTDNKMWMIWNGKFWQHDVQEYVKNYIEIMAEKMLYDCNSIEDMNERMRMLKNIEHIYSSSGKESLLKEARHIQGIPVMNSDFDKNEYLICTESGVINLKTKEIQDYKKEDMISMSTGCELDMDHDPRQFLKFIHEIFVDPEVVNYVHKALGYSMTESSREQCLFILHGDGNNGKSLLLDIIYNTLGSYGITSKSQLLTEQKFGNTNSEEVARLKGKRFVAVEEIQDGDAFNEQLVKSLTSGIGNQVARFLYGNSFEFAFKGKIWIATNYEPRVKGTDKGVWRRIVKIPVPTDFTGREDKDLRQKLLAELPQILGWLFKGYMLYEKEGLQKPEVIRKSIEEYKEEMDLVQQWINEYCETKPSYFEKANVLYDNFRAFCQRRDQRTNQTVFGRNLGKKFKKYNSGSGIVYIGLRLKKEAEDLSKRVAYEQLKVDDDI